MQLHAVKTAPTPINIKAALHRDAVWRHVENHVSDETKASYLLGPAKVADLANAAADESRTVIDYLAIVRSILMNALDSAAQRGKPYEIERISGRMVEVLREIGRITGEVSQFAAATINITNNTQILNSAPFMDLQSGLLQICARHPEARADIIALFRDLDARHSAPAAKLIDAREVENV
ncbi:hypothetical protein RZS28_00850 [Methylocapsa polymorpha]|uniref:Uncharacterized protein n=1 Tax=Methylocapsa polymorpha TaxID=3080828 RepID=A0ABZ0HVH3_9HYPH|nr:hypothetical protein RZS28_00850 [Methylocapsa sp. RX1]